MSTKTYLKIDSNTALYSYVGKLSNIYNICDWQCTQILCNFCVIVKICPIKFTFFMEVKNQLLLSSQNVEQSQAQC